MSPKNSKIAIVAGGTGGHIYPGIALAQEIMARDGQARVLFIGSDEGLEQELIPRAGFELKTIRARAFFRFASLIGFCQAFCILRSFAPRALIATGSFTSWPAVLAAKVLGLPIYLHEQNVLPGLTNRLLRRVAQQIFLSFEESTRYLAGQVTGNPVRREILSADRGAARAALKLAENEKLLLIVGGSQGSRKINETVIAALPSIQEQISNLKIIHLVGQRDARQMQAKLAGQNYAFYQMVDYLYNVADVLAAADLVLSRAGATAIAEFTDRGLPMILVPFPFSAAGHQELNAQVMEQAGAAIMIKNDELTPEKLVPVLTAELRSTAGRRQKCLALAKPTAAREIINALA